eukprot:m.34387 g.34387  ORF g.34387 m.34387 type:complete len:589 (+) comp12297_c0_seq1:109-1875(+)
MSLTEEAALHLVGNVPGFIEHLTKDSAKELLKGEPDGTYVIRYSHRSSALVLSINHNGRARHFPFSRIGRNFTLDGQTKKPSVSDLLSALGKRGFKDSSGHRVRIGRPSQAAADAHLEQQSYYLPDLTRDAADELLSALPIGTFLVRVNRHGNLTFSVHAKKKVTHVPVEVEKGRYYVSDVAPQATIQALVDVIVTKHKSIQTDRHGKIEMTSPLSEAQAADLPGDQTVRSTIKRRAHSHNEGFAHSNRIEPMSIEQPKALNITMGSSIACFGCTVGIEAALLSSVMLHYLSIIGSLLLAVFFYQNDQRTTFIAVLGLMGFRLLGFALTDVVFERQRSSWLSFFELRPLGLIVYYLGDAYAREDEVVTLMHLLRVWYTLWEGGPVLVLAVYAALTSWLANETIDVYVLLAAGTLFVSCLISTMATFFQDYITQETSIINSVSLTLYSLGGLVARTLAFATGLFLTPFYILVAMGVGLLVLELASSAIIAPRVAMETSSARRLFLIRAMIGWLGPWPTARLKRERLRHGLIHMAASAGLAVAVLRDDSNLGDGLEHQIVLSVVAGALALQLAGWLLFLRMPGDDDCTVL